MADSFVGRRAELAALRAHLDEARTGRPRVVQVQGSAGMGKTALIDRFLSSSPGGRALRDATGGWAAGVYIAAATMVISLVLYAMVQEHFPGHHEDPEPA